MTKAGFNSPLYVRQTKRMGRGVFARRKIRNGELIELSPVIQFSERDCKKLEGTILDDYVFAWGSRGRRACIALGLGSLFNHSSNPNAIFNGLRHSDQIEFVSCREIKKGDQVFVDYGWEKGDIELLRSKK